MPSRLHSLRSASNEMHSLSSASSAESTKYFACFSRHRRSAARNGAHSLLRFASWSHVAGSFHPSACSVGGGCCSASNQSVVGASRRSAAPGGQSVGAAEYGCSFLSLRACSGVRVAKLRGLLRVYGRSAVPARDAQPFNQPDMPRQAGSCRLSQTLGSTTATPRRRQQSTSFTSF
jgi:hypothetical protein